VCGSLLRWESPRNICEIDSVISSCELDLMRRDVHPERYVKVSDPLLRQQISCPISAGLTLDEEGGRSSCLDGVRYD